VLGNYGGDRMSFAQACEDFEDDGDKTATVIVADDVASAPSAERAKRRGVAGMIFAFKTAGAAADGGASMDEVERIAAHTADRTRSIGVALSPCLIPGAAAPGFTVDEGQMELGMGIHGEPGVERRAIAPADEVASAMVGRLLADRAGNGGRVAVLVNSLGATPLEELLILYRATDALLAKARLEIARHYVGHYATSMEMAGCSISILDLDNEIESLLSKPTTCPFWPR
jgi:dihydroxyacetone kinase-like protein